MSGSRRVALAGLFLLELILYGAFVAAYCLLVLHYLGFWLAEVFNANRTLYAFTALMLIVAQGILLEMLTRVLVGALRKRID